MNIKRFENGLFSVNTYLLTENTSCLIIDPGSDIHILLNDIKKLNVNCQGILITHPHIDHVEGVSRAKKQFPSAPIYLSADAVKFLSDIPNQARLFGLPVPESFICDKPLEHDGSVHIEPFSIQYIQTPGHCPGSLSFLINGSLFTGDVLFQGSIGRTDLSGGNFSLLSRSITEKLYLLPDSTPVYPGHGDATSIGWEKKNNPYV